MAGVLVIMIVGYALFVATGAAVYAHENSS